MMLAILKIIIIIITTKLTEIGKVGVEGCVEVSISDVDSLCMSLNSVSKCYANHPPPGSRRNLSREPEKEVRAALAGPSINRRPCGGGRGPRTITMSP